MFIVRVIQISGMCKILRENEGKFLSNYLPIHRQGKAIISSILFCDLDKLKVLSVGVMRCWFSHECTRDVQTIEEKKN